MPIIAARPQALAPTGEILFHEFLTEDDLGDIGNRIIIEEPASSVPILDSTHSVA
jgi:hypothetical protein